MALYNYRCLFQNAFDHVKAKKEGVIVPSAGVDEEYDRAVEDIQSTEKQLKEYLDRQKTRIGCRVRTLDRSFVLQTGVQLFKGLLISSV